MSAARDIPRAYAGSDAGGGPAVSAGIAWIATQLEAVGGTPMLYVPGRDSVGDDDLVGQLARKIPTATWRSDARPSWTSGPVLACRPDMVHLGRVDQDPRTRALCVVGWTDDDDVKGWIAAFDPELLDRSGKPTPRAQSIDDEVVVQGLMTMSMMVNHGNNLTGSMDKRDAIDVLQRLHDAGHRFDADAVFAWSLANGWNDRGAGRLREFAHRIAAGERPRKGMRSALRVDIVQQWRDRADGRPDRSPDT